MPRECDSVEDIPNDLIVAIEQAQRIITWQENSLRGEMPERWMWHLDHEIVAHFDRVEAERDEKYGGDSSSSESDTEQPMMVNEYAARMRGR